MAPWVQRLITVGGAVGVGLLGVLVPATAPFAIPAAIGLVGWAVPHTADRALARDQALQLEARRGPPPPPALP